MGRGVSHRVRAGTPHSRFRYASQLRFCTNYAFGFFYAWRNRLLCAVHGAYYRSQKAWPVAISAIFNSSEDAWGWNCIKYRLWRIAWQHSVKLAFSQKCYLICLPSRPWLDISGFHWHNSTASKLLRYSRPRERGLPSRTLWLAPLTLWLVLIFM